MQRIDILEIDQFVCPLKQHILSQNLLHVRLLLQNFHYLIRPAGRTHPVDSGRILLRIDFFLAVTLKIVERNAPPFQIIGDLLHLFGIQLQPVLRQQIQTLVFPDHVLIFDKKPVIPALQDVRFYNPSEQLILQCRIRLHKHRPAAQVIVQPRFEPGKICRTRAALRPDRRIGRQHPVLHGRAPPLPVSVCQKIRQ